MVGCNRSCRFDDGAPRINAGDTRTANNECESAKPENERDAIRLHTQSDVSKLLQAACSFTTLETEIGMTSDPSHFAATTCGRQGGLTRRTVMAMTAAAGSSALLAPGSGRAGEPPGKPTGQILVGLSQEPTVFNPLMPHLGNDEGIHWNLFSPLWGVDPAGTLVAELAVEVPSVANGGLSEDGLKWRVKLRSDVTWHDGATFSADDVKFTLELINNPNFRAGNRTGHRLVQNIQVVSPTEITWEMSRPYAPYISILAWTFMVPKHAFDQAADPNTAPFNTAPIGTGAFKWGERVPGDHLTLNANERFYGKGPYVERAIFRYIPDLTVMFAQFETGSIDYTGYQGITADHYAAAKKLPGKTVVVAPSAGVEGITLNLTRPQFQDQQVREALYYGMDKKSIIDLIYYGLPTDTESYLPHQCWAFNPNLPKHDYDPAKAKQILDAAGWLPGPDGIRQKNGVRLEFINSTTAGNQVREQAQEVLQQNWREIGVAIQIKNMPAAVIWGDYFAMSKYDSVMVAWDYMTGADPDSTTVFDAGSTPAKGGAGWNSMQYDNPQVNELLRAAATTVDHSKRKEMYEQLQTIIRNDLPILPMFQDVKTEGTNSKLIGYTPNVNVSSNLWNLRTWYWAS